MLIDHSVLLQPLTIDPPPHAKCKDKFLVQSAFITPDEEMHTLSEMWSNTEQTNKSAIQEQKIKCVYLAAEDGRAENGIREEEEEGMESRVMDESVSQAYILSPRLDARLGGFQRCWYKEWIGLDVKEDLRSDSLLSAGGHRESVRCYFVPQWRSFILGAGGGALHPSCSKSLFDGAK